MSRVRARGQETELAGSARGASRRLPLAAVLLVVLVLAARAVHAQPAPERPPPPTLRAVIRVASEDDAAILARVRGHVSDLDVALVVLEGELERREAQRRAAALRLAHRPENDARAVVWFTALGGGGYRVHVADVERKQLLERDVEPDAGKPVDRSALLETAALVVRSAFFALQEGADIGPPEQFKDPEEPPAPPPPPPPRPRAPGVAPELSVGAGWAFDGAGERGHPGANLRAGLARGRLGLELGVHVPLPAQLAGEFAEVTLWRIPVWVGLHAAVWPPSPRFRVRLGLRGSLVVYDLP